MSHDWENDEVVLQAFALIDRNNKMISLGYTEEDFKYRLMVGDRIVKLLPETKTKVKPAIKRQRRYAEVSN